MFFAHQNRLMDYSILIVLVGLSITTCRPVQPAGRTNESTLNIATARLGKEIETYPNSTEEYLLCLQNGDAQSILRKFLIIRTSDSSVLLEDSFSPGYVKWKSKTSIEVLSVPGILKENESLSDFVKIIDISSAKN